MKEKDTCAWRWTLWSIRCLEISKFGYDVTVIEKEPKLCGLCTTNEYKGYRFDLGGHRFISKNNDLVDNVCRMMGDELLISNRRSVVLLKGKSFNYPLSAQDIFLKMDIWTNLKAFTSYLIAVVSKALLRKIGINAALDIISNNLCKREDTQLMDSEDELVWATSIMV
ncbi:MAG: NAD(P)-binding protein [Planctomycetota bacterium]